MKEQQAKDYFISIAKLTAKNSTCKRLAVGCVLTSDNIILSTGFNGAPTGMEHCNERKDNPEPGMVV